MRSICSLTKYSTDWYYPIKYILLFSSLTNNIQPHIRVIEYKYIYPVLFPILERHIHHSIIQLYLFFFTLKIKWPHKLLVSSLFKSNFTYLFRNIHRFSFSIIKLNEVRITWITICELISEYLYFIDKVHTLGSRQFCVLGKVGLVQTKLYF